VRWRNKAMPAKAGIYLCKTIVKQAYRYFINICAASASFAVAFSPGASFVIISTK
jgi:hypothetical protein